MSFTVLGGILALPFLFMLPTADHEKVTISLLAAVVAGFVGFFLNLSSSKQQHVVNKKYFGLLFDSFSLVTTLITLLIHFQA